MLRWITLLVVSLLLAARADAQQLNGPAASFVVSGQNAATFPIPVALSTPAIVTFDTVGHPSSPYALLVGGVAAPGIDFGPAGIFNLDAGAFAFLDGFSPVDALDALAVTAANGHSLFAFSLFAPDIDVGLQAVVVDPTSIFGVRLTGTTRATTAPAGTKVVLFSADDESKHVALAQPVLFAGQSWNGFWVSSNGCITFGAPDPSPLPSEAAMSAGPPRVALAWRDLDSRFAGRIEVATTTSNQTVVKWIDVPIRDGVGGPLLAETLNGTVRFDATGVSMRIDVTAAGEQITGVSPGGGAQVTPSHDLSLEVPISAPAPEPVFELIANAADYDLCGADITYAPAPAPNQFVLDVPLIPLAVTELFPPIGPTGGLASVVLRGTGFLPGAQVTIGGVPALSISYLGREQLHAITPLGSAGPADVEVLLPDGRSVLLPNAYTYVPAAATGQSLPIVAGGSIEVPFDHGFVYPHFGVYRQSVWINASGCLTFGGPDADPQPSPAKMLADPPRVAMLWHDWQPGPTSQVLVYNTAYFFTVGFVDVLPAGGGAPVSFATTLSHHGGMSFASIGTLPLASAPLIGASAGAASAPNVAGDLSLFLGPSQPSQPIFEVFDLANPFDLGGLTFGLTPTADGAVTFTGSTS